MPPRKSAAAPTGGEPPVDFEDSMKRLETIVDELESGQLTLDDSIARYEEGVKLSRRLTQTLDQAEKRIERLVEGAEGEPGTESMELKLGGDEGAEGELPF
jgi:exodeoxyribonuclease VII small subunit